jgi:hypothetical protein
MSEAPLRERPLRPDVCQPGTPSCPSAGQQPYPPRSESVHSASLSIPARGTGTGGSRASGTVSRRPPGGPERKTIWRRFSQMGPVGTPGMACLTRRLAGVSLAGWVPGRSACCGHWGRRITAPFRPGQAPASG